MTNSTNVVAMAPKALDPRQAKARLKDEGYSEKKHQARAGRDSIHFSIADRFHRVSSTPIETGFGNPSISSRAIILS